jgi:cation transport ATPase
MLEEALALAAAVEAHSEHPLASALLAYAGACLGVVPLQGKSADGMSPRSAKQKASSGAGTERDVSWVRPAHDVQMIPGSASCNL